METGSVEKQHILCHFKVWISALLSDLQPCTPRLAEGLQLYFTSETGFFFDHLGRSGTLSLAQPWAGPVT